MQLNYDREMLREPGENYEQERIKKDRERIFDLQDEVLKNSREFLQSQANGHYRIKGIWPEETGSD